MNHAFTFTVLILWLVTGSIGGIILNDNETDCPAEFTLPCGVNAHCQYKTEVPECICNQGYTGDPYAYCEEQVEHETETTTNTRTKRDTDEQNTSVVNSEDLEPPPSPSIVNDICVPNPCLNGGVCQKLGTYYACMCPAPWCGWNCEKIQGDETDECEKWAKKGYCENDFREFMLDNCPDSCRDWFIWKYQQDYSEGSGVDPDPRDQPEGSGVLDDNSDDDLS